LLPGRQASGRQVGQPWRKLPAQGPGLPAAQPSRFLKTWKRFAEAGQQPAAKARAMATGQAGQGQLRQTCRPAAPPACHYCRVGRQAGGRLGSKAGKTGAARTNLPGSQRRAMWKPLPACGTAGGRQVGQQGRQGRHRLPGIQNLSLPSNRKTLHIRTIFSAPHLILTCFFPYLWSFYKEFRHGIFLSFLIFLTY